MPKFQDEARADKFNNAEIRLLSPKYITELTLIAQEKLGLLYDGRIGPETFAALDKVRADRQRSIAPPAPPPPAPPAPTPEAPPAPTAPQPGPAALPPRPRSYKDAAALFKVPAKHFSGEQESAAWCKANLTEIHGDAGGLVGNLHFYLKIHKTVAPHLKAAWAQALATSAWAQALAKADPQKGLQAGGYVYRTVRHRPPPAPLSPHGLGVAVDVRPDLNPGIDVKRGEAPIAFSPEWYSLFPGSMDREFVQAFRDHGFTWGADWDQDGHTDDEIWLDLMHFEWIDRTGGKPRSEPGQ